MTPVVVDTPAPGEPTVRVLPPALVPAQRGPAAAAATAAAAPTAEPTPAAATILPRPAQPPAPAEAVARPGGRHLRPDPPAPDRRWVDHLLTLLALLGIVTTLVTVFAAKSGLQPLVVRSGSMEPTIHTGAMVLVRQVPASELAVGDVVAVERPDHTRVTHRIVSIEHRGRTAELVLKGDANEDPDPAPVVVERAGRLVASVSWLGRVGGFVASAKGGFVLGWVVSMVTLMVLRRRSA